MSFNHLKFRPKLSKNPQQSVVLLITSPIQCSPLDDIEPMFIRVNARGFTTSCFKFVSIFLELFHLALTKATEVFSFEVIVICKNFFNECLFHLCVLSQGFCYDACSVDD